MTTIVLPEDLYSVVESEVHAHGYASASDYVAALIRQEQKRQAKRRLEEMILEGLHSGNDLEMNDEVWERMRSERHRQAGPSA